MDSFRMPYQNGKRSDIINSFLLNYQDSKAIRHELATLKLDPETIIFRQDSDCQKYFEEHPVSTKIFAQALNQTSFYNYFPEFGKI